MDIANDIERIAEQERRLRCPRMDLDSVWHLGSRLWMMAGSQGMSLTIEIRLAGHSVFFATMPGTTPANADWARRKRNTVELMHRSSYGVGRSLERDGRTLEDTMGLPTRDYASHGGSFPLVVEGAGPVGVVTVSGAPQRDDHNIVVAALAELCNIPLAEIALA